MKSSNSLLSKRFSFLILEISASKSELPCKVVLDFMLESKQYSEQCVALQSSSGLPQFSQVSDNDIQKIQNNKKLTKIVGNTRSYFYAMNAY